MSIEQTIRRLVDAMRAAGAEPAWPAAEVTIRDRERSSGRRSGRLGGTWQDPVWRRALADGIDVALGLGGGSWHLYFSDLTHDYIRINAGYRT